MPTIKEAAKQRKSYAWMISMIMQEKDRLARQRLVEINNQQPALKEAYQTYLHLYNLHIKPMMPKVDQYLSNLNEKRKIEHFLQGQAEHQAQVEKDQSREPTMGLPGQRSWTLGPQVERLPYAGKNEVGKAPRQARRNQIGNQVSMSENDAKEVIEKLKKLDPNLFADLLKQVSK